MRASRSCGYGGTLDLIALMLRVNVSLVLFRAGADDRSPAAETVCCESIFEEV
jgi:hypothetical protein